MLLSSSADFCLKVNTLKNLPGTLPNGLDPDQADRGYGSKLFAKGYPQVTNVAASK